MCDFLNPGQLMIGTSKAWFCGNDGSVYELTGQEGSWFPQYGKNFTYTGEYVIVPENDTDWKVKFLTSGTFTATDALLIDVFAVGGGGGGFYESRGSGPHLVGGGGGYTKTEKSVYLEKDKSYEIIVGAGSNASNRGGTTSGFNITAYGGYGGNTNTFSDNAGDGGSGGAEMLNAGSNIQRGGRNGANGAAIGTGGWASLHGQGTTTYEYEDSSLELYSNGGDIAQNTSGVVSGRDYYGDGGGVSNSTTYSGTSGVLIIRNHRE